MQKGRHQAPVRKVETFAGKGWTQMRTPDRPGQLAGLDVDAEPVQEGGILHVARRCVHNFLQLLRCETQLSKGLKIGIRGCRTDSFGACRSDGHNLTMAVRVASLPAVVWQVSGALGSWMLSGPAALSLGPHTCACVIAVQQGQRTHAPCTL